MQAKFRYGLILSLIMTVAPAQAALKVLTCESDWAALVTQIGGKHVKVSSATTGRQDPHRIEARPSLIARVRNADLLICTGLDLEAAWLPILLRQSGNGAIQPGQPGYFEAGRQVPVLELPSRLDRAQGDVHAYGNPHVHLDPHNIARIAEALGQRLAQLDPAHAAEYTAGLQAFNLRWSAAITRWEQVAAPLKDVNVITHHKDMVYLLHWLGMRELGNLEPKPGLQPSGAHLAKLLQLLKQEPARMILRTPYQSDRASQWLADKAGIPALVLPTSVGGSKAATDLFAMYEDLLARLLGALK